MLSTVINQTYAAKKHFHCLGHSDLVDLLKRLHRKRDWLLYCSLLAFEESSAITNPRLMYLLLLEKDVFEALFAVLLMQNIKGFSAVLFEFKIDLGCLKRIDRADVFGQTLIPACIDPPISSTRLHMLWNLHIEEYLIIVPAFFLDVPEEWKGTGQLIIKSALNAQRNVHWVIRMACWIICFVLNLNLFFIK